MPRRALGLAVVVLSLLSLATPAYASTILIDFEDLDDFAFVGTPYPGLTFTNASVRVSEFSLGEDEFPPRSGEKVAIDEGGAIRIDFATPVSNFEGYFTYLVPLTLEAFDSTDVSLGSVTSLFTINLGLSGDLGSSPNELLALSFGNISYVSIVGDPLGFSFAVDDVSFEQMTAVPEPSTLMLCGVGLAAFARRRLKQRGRTCG